MKRLLKILLLILGALLLIILAIALYINISGIPKYDNPGVTFELKADSAAIAEGARISSMLCSECHRGEDGKLSGAFIKDLPPSFGKAWSANITQHSTYGIGDWSAGEIAYMIRTGVKKDGSYAPPYMPKFPLMADEDLNAVIAFLKSDHPIVQPSSTASIPCKPSFLVKVLSRFAFVPMPYSEEPIKMPDPEDKLAFGKYLATAKFACFECHSAEFKTNLPLDPENSAGYMGGGNPMLNLDGDVILTANITPHETSGIGAWTFNEFEQAVRWGIGRDGEPMRYPMIPYTALKDAELEAIWAYIMTVPEMDKSVNRDLNPGD